MVQLLTRAGFLSNLSHIVFKAFFVNHEGREGPLKITCVFLSILLLITTTSIERLFYLRSPAHALSSAVLLLGERNSGLTLEIHWTISMIIFCSAPILSFRSMTVLLSSWPSNTLSIVSLVCKSSIYKSNIFLRWLSSAPAWPHYRS